MSRPRSFPTSGGDLHGRTAKGRSFVVSCRTANGEYEDVVGIVPLSNTRTIRAPDGGVAKCRVKRSNKTLVATMTMRTS